MELRCVVGVIRHGDRTPKQKLKLEVKHPMFFEIFRKYDGYKTKNIKLKKPQQLQEILDVSRRLLEFLKSGSSELIEEKRSKLEQIKNVLEMYGHFSGINRKVQLKYQPKGRPRNTSSEEDETPREASLLLILKWGGELTPSGRIQAEELGRVFRCMYPGGQDLLIGGLPPNKECSDPKQHKGTEKPGGQEANATASAKPTPEHSSSVAAVNPSSATAAGSNGEYSGTQGLGLLRLHSTYRHDLKIYASDEGRVQMTAAAFAKGLLALEGELTPILVQMVKSANTNGLLDNDSDCSSKYQNMEGKKFPREELHTCHMKKKKKKQKKQSLSRVAKSDGLNGSNTDLPALEDYFNNLDENNRLQHAKERVKSKLHEMMQQDSDFSQEDDESLNPCHQISISKALSFIQNPVQCCRHIHRLIHNLYEFIERQRQVLDDSDLYHGETWELMARRWVKLEKDFKTKNGTFDISKIPDIYDCIKYDLQHNRKVLQSDDAEELYTFAKNMADVVIPQEYGMTRTEKLTIAQGICAPLLRKIRADLQRNIEAESEEEEACVNRLNPRYSSGVSSPGRHVRTRLYFTSESHIHSLLTIISEVGLVDSKDEQWLRAMEYVSLVSELNYMTQVVIMLYEDPTKDPSSDERFHVELHFSPGVNCVISRELPPGPGFRPHSRNHEQQSGSSSQQSSNADASEAPENTGMPSSQSSMKSDESKKTDEIPAEEPEPQTESSSKSENLNPPTFISSIKCSTGNLSKVFDAIDMTCGAKQPHDEEYDESDEEDDDAEDDEEMEASDTVIEETVSEDFVKAHMTSTSEAASASSTTSDPIPMKRARSRESNVDDDAAEEEPPESFQSCSYPGSCSCSHQQHQRRSFSSCSKMSHSLEKSRGARPKSFESEETSECQHGKRDETHPSKSHSMDEVGDEDAFKRSHRHSIPSHRLNNYLKFLNELAAKGSTTALVFSTAVISGSSSAPNLKEMPQPSDPAQVHMPAVRPLETLHNSLSLRQLDSFLGFVTSANFKAPNQTPPRPLRAPPPLSFERHSSGGNGDNAYGVWSGPPSFVSSCETSPSSAAISVIDFYRNLRFMRRSQEEDEEQ